MNDVLAYTLLTKTIRESRTEAELLANVDARVQSLRASGFEESQIDAAFAKLQERKAVQINKDGLLGLNRYALQGKDLTDDFMIECVISANRRGISIVDFLEVLGVPAKLTTSRVLKLARKKLVSWGVSMERCWVTDEGLALVEGNV